MGEATVKAEMGVSAQTLWKLVEDFGRIPWIPGGDEVEVTGEGVGMIRSLAGGAVREKLEIVDPGQMRIGYTILAGLPVPATDYHATMTVRALSEGRCELDWSCRFVPDGVSDEEAAAQFRGLYEMMIGWIKTELGTD